MLLMNAFVDAVIGHLQVEAGRLAAVSKKLKALKAEQFKKGQQLFSLHNQEKERISDINGSKAQSRTRTQKLRRLDEKVHRATSSVQCAEASSAIRHMSHYHLSAMLLFHMHSHSLAECKGQLLCILLIDLNTCCIRRHLGDHGVSVGAKARYRDIYHVQGVQMRSRLDKLFVCWS